MTADRYIVTPGENGTWDIVDSLHEQAVGVAANEQDAGKAAQQLNSLLKANETRLERGRLRKTVKAAGYIGGREHVAQLILNCPESLRRMRVEEVLCWIPRVRGYQASRILIGLERSTGPRRVSISSTRTMGTLTPREREALADYLAGERVDERWVAA